MKNVIKIILSIPNILNTLYWRIRGVKIGKYSQISLNCSIDTPKGVKIGCEVFIAPGCHIYSNNSNISISDFVMIGPNVSLLAANKDYSDPSLPMKKNGKYICREIQIQSDVWIGEKAIILPGVTLGRGCIIAAGSIVTKDVLPFSIVGGSPAKFLKWRFNKKSQDKANKLDLTKFLGVKKIRDEI